MKKNNKGFMLLEAIVAISLLVVALLFSGYILTTVKDTREKTEELIANLQVKKIFNRLEYIKERLLEKGKNTFYLKNNEKYAGWNILKITPNQTIDELNWNYEMIENDGFCSSTSVWPNYNTCLKKLDSWKWGYLRVKGEYQKIDTDGMGKIINNGNKIEIDSTCDIEDLGSRCLAYKIKIEDLSDNESHKRRSYIRSDGVTVVIKSTKLITIKIKEKDNQIREYKHILSIY